MIRISFRPHLQNLESFKICFNHSSSLCSFLGPLCSRILFDSGANMMRYFKENKAKGTDTKNSCIQFDAADCILNCPINSKYVHTLLCTRHMMIGFRRNKLSDLFLCLVSVSTLRITLEQVRYEFLFEPNKSTPLSTMYTNFEVQEVESTLNACSPMA